jgi:hypothetical protein
MTLLVSVASFLLVDVFVNDDDDNNEQKPQVNWWHPFVSSGYFQPTVARPYVGVQRSRSPVKSGEEIKRVKKKGKLRWGSEKGHE